jgi:attachment p12 family protein
MTFDWQNAVALAVVIAAAGYLGRRAWQTVVHRKQGGCGACGNCSTEKSPAGAALVPLDSLTKPKAGA